MIITEPKTVHYFDLSKKVDNKLNHETDFILKQNEFLAEHRTKNEVSSYCPNISIEMIFINTENSKSNESHSFVEVRFKKLV